MTTFSGQLGLTLTNVSNSYGPYTSSLHPDWGECLVSVLFLFTFPITRAIFLFESQSGVAWKTKTWRFNWERKDSINVVIDYSDEKCQTEKVFNIFSVDRSHHPSMTGYEAAGEWRPVPCPLFPCSCVNPAGLCPCVPVWVSVSNWPIFRPQGVSVSLAESTK